MISMGRALRKRAHGGRPGQSAVRAVLAKGKGEREKGKVLLILGPLSAAETCPE